MSVNNGKNIIDSRDIIARIDELVDERRNLQDALDNAKETLTDAQDDTSALSAEDTAELQEAVELAQENLNGWEEDEGVELASLESLAEEAGGCSGWSYGEALIRDSYFEQYAEDLAEEVGAFTGQNYWPLNCIDWTKAAQQLQQDYTSVDFDGVDYWIRS
jgi:multidrug efflux pump subunit AcrA (membrane-fusion protein)